MIKKVNIALLGCGKLGQGFYRLFDTKKSKIFEETGIELNIQHILVKHLGFKRDKIIPKEIITDNINKIINDRSIQIVVDAIGGIEPSYGIIKKFLNKGCHVISANHTLLASKMRSLFELAYSKNVHLKYDASLLGGISTIRTIRRDLIGTKITSIWGIISGSVNYILTEMTRTRKSLKETLKFLPLGDLTESQISVDYEGSEAAQKLALLAAIAFGVEVNYLHIHAEGISHITAYDLECASMFGFEFKMIAVIKNNENNLELHLHPTLIPKDHPLTQVKNGYNAFYIETDTMGEIMLYSKGLGVYTISNTIIRDLVDIIEEVKSESFNFYEFPHWANKNILPMTEIHAGYYLRFRCMDQPGVIGQITTILGKYNINISSAHASLTKNYKNRVTGFIHIFIKHACEKDIVSSIEKIKKLDIIVGKPVTYRVLNEVSHVNSNITS